MAVKIKSIKKLSEKMLTGDIEVNNTHSYQLDNGIVSHNSQLCDSASGIHPRYSEHYIRTVRSDRNEPLARFMMDQGFPYEADYIKKENGLVFSFPIKNDSNCVFRKDISAIEHLEIWKTYQLHWCEHKPSITVYVKENEWLDIAAWVYKNFDIVSGVSFLPWDNGSYIQAPYQECTEEKYNEVLEKIPTNVDWSKLRNYEKEDNTVGSQEYACTGNACELK